MKPLTRAELDNVGPPVDRHEVNLFVAKEKSLRQRSG